MTGEVLDETAIEAAESYKLLYVFDRGRRLPIPDAGELIRIHLDAIGGDDKAEVFYLLGVEFTLVDVQLQAPLSQATQDFQYVIGVFFLAIAVHQNVVHIRCAELIEKISHSFVDIVLERSWGVAKPERHHEIFKLTVTCIEGG